MTRPRTCAWPKALLRQGFFIDNDVYLNLRYSVKDGTGDLLILDIDWRGGELQHFGGSEHSSGRKFNIVFIK